MHQSFFKWTKPTQIMVELKAMYLVKVFRPEAHTTFQTMSACTHWRGQEHQKVHKQRSSSYLNLQKTSKILHHIQPWRAVLCVKSMNQRRHNLKQSFDSKVCAGAQALISGLTNSLSDANIFISETQRVPTPAPVSPMFHGQCELTKWVWNLRVFETNRFKTPSSSAVKHTWGPVFQPLVYLEIENLHHRPSLGAPVKSGTLQ